MNDNSDKDQVINDRLAPEDLLEIAEKKAGNQAVQLAIEKHLEQIMNIREKFPLSDLDLLSSNIINNNDIPDKLRTEIGQLQAKIKNILSTRLPPE